MSKCAAASANQNEVAAAKARLGWDRGPPAASCESDRSTAARVNDRPSAITIGKNVSLVDRQRPLTAPTPAIAPGSGGRPPRSIVHPRPTRTLAKNKIFLR